MKKKKAPPASKTANLGFARVDLERLQRCGAAEVIFGEGKTPAQITHIARTLDAAAQPVLVTRSEPAAYRAVKKALPRAVWYPASRIILGRPLSKAQPGAGSIAICVAGTTDRPVAEEAEICARFWGHQVTRFDDIGVAGLHRLMECLEEIREADVILAVAGMEAALPSVLGGLVRQPVIAVPTSVGYGVSQGGQTALMGMLTSCASGITVVNIDNGFGAAYAAHRILGHA